MNRNIEILKKFIDSQKQRLQDDVSKQGYKDNSPYRNNPFNIIQGTPQGTPITMKGVSTPLIGMDEFGNKQKMYPGQEYYYPGSQVKEIPVAQMGGTGMMYADRDYQVGGLTKAQVGQEVKVRNKNGEVVTMDTNSPEYRSLYQQGLIQSSNAGEGDTPYFGGELPEVETNSKLSPFAKSKGHYDKKHGRENFINQKKDEYIKNLGSNNNWYGADRNNFPEQVLKEINQNYDYNRNTYALEQLAKKEKFDLNTRGAWVDKLTPSQKEALINSKYSSQLNPSEFSNTLSGLQELVNTGYIGRPLNFNIPGLTPKEQKEDAESKLSGLKALSFANLPGNYIANAAKNSTTSSYGDFRDMPMFGSQRMGNVSEMESVALNPINYEAIGSLPQLTSSGYKFLKNSPQMAKALVTEIKANAAIPSSARNFLASHLMNNQVSKGLVKPALPELPKIDLSSKAAINVQNDIAKNMSAEQYDNLLENIYFNNKPLYDNPLVEFKGDALPSSFFANLGNNTKNGGPGRWQKFIHDLGMEHANSREGLLFKEKFCLPGSECARSANAVTNKTFTDVTGMPFNAEENAHNAWHMQDQMTRHGGEDVSGFGLKVGDRILMGNGKDQSTFVQGYTADKSVRHAGMYAGVKVNETGDRIPLIFESGKNNAMYLNPLAYTFTGENTALKSIRPSQFIDESFGKGLVDKNIRYAFRDKPSVATYTSDNKAAQNVLDEAEKHREIIKKSHDITNDEFDELRNSLIGIGAQETKLNGALPGSKLSKAKVQLQNALNKAGLTKPIKQTINTVKKTLNTNIDANTTLPKFPGTSVVEMEAAKLSDANNISFENALKQVKSNYQAQPKFSYSTVEPSKGMFRQKFQTELDRVSGFGKDLKDKNSVENGLGLMSQNYNKIKKAYPNATPRQLMDITTLMWNSPGKALNPQLVDFYIFGKNNPNPSKFNFDYVRKINEAKNKIINIHPARGASEIEDYNKLFRNTYPEIQYKYGGSLDMYQKAGTVRDSVAEFKAAVARSKAAGYGNTRNQAMLSTDKRTQMEREADARLSDAELERKARMRKEILAQGRGQFNSAQDFKDASGAIDTHFRLSLNDNIFDDYLNPLAWTGSMANKLGAVPDNINRGNYGEAAMAFAEPLAYGAIGEFAAPYISKAVNAGKQFANPYVNQAFGLMRNPQEVNALLNNNAILNEVKDMSLFTKGKYPTNGKLFNYQNINTAIPKYNPFSNQIMNIQKSSIFEKPLAEELHPYISRRGEPFISREEEVFRNAMGPEYRAAKELENTSFFDAKGNSISAPNSTYTPHVEDEYMKAFNNARNKQVTTSSNPFESRNSSIINLTEEQPLEILNENSVLEAESRYDYPNYDEPHHTDTMYDRANAYFSNDVRNKSGYSKSELMRNASDSEKELLNNIDDSAFENTVTSPNGSTVPYATSAPSGKLGYDMDSKSLYFNDATLLSNEEYARRFNENIGKLNDKIKLNNTTGVEYFVESLDPRGYINFRTPKQIVNGVEIPEGVSNWGVDIRPAEWEGTVENVFNKEYFDHMPGINMRHSTFPVFSDKVARQGSGTYKSINEFLKELNLGRVKTGFNHQTPEALNAWEHYIKSGKGAGYYSEPGIIQGALFKTGGNTYNKPGWLNS